MQTQDTPSLRCWEYDCCAPAGADPSVGDIAYYAPWGNLALFYKDFTYSEGLIVLGKLDGDAEKLSVSGSVKVTIELLGKEDPKEADEAARRKCAKVIAEEAIRRMGNLKRIAAAVMLAVPGRSPPS